MQKENVDTTLSAKWINLADARLGTKVLFATDDFFAEKENLIAPGRGVFIPDKYTENGKWMDGWESRRKRTPGNDHCVVRLGAAGIIRGIDVDTNHFLGNHPPFASLEACAVKGDPNGQTEWTEICVKQSLKPGSQNLLPIQSDRTWTHVRLQIYPDGGVARLRVYGEVVVDWTQVSRAEQIDLVAVHNGGRALLCNDMFFSPKENLIMPGRGRNMGDGWETRRRRTPGHDWLVLGLGHLGEVKKIEIDTAHYKGNYPDRCSIEGVKATADADIHSGQELKWQSLLPETKLKPDHQHYFEKELLSMGPITHIRLNIFPDGGISRLRCWGLIK